jgi:hypothetical protein
MKKLVVLSILVLGLLSFNSNVSKQSLLYDAGIHVNDVGCHYGRCRATAKSTGKQCMHCVSNSGDSYCWQHK